MADFCTKCSFEMFGPDFDLDINVKEMFEKLEPGYFFNVLCEGCTMIGVMKTVEGRLKLGFIDKDKPDLEFDTIEDFEKHDWRHFHRN